MVSPVKTKPLEKKLYPFSSFMFTPSYKMIFASQYLILRKRGETEAAISAPKQVLNTLAM